MPSGQTCGNWLQFEWNFFSEWLMQIMLLLPSWSPSEHWWESVTRCSCLLLPCLKRSTLQLMKLLLSGYYKYQTLDDQWLCICLELILVLLYPEWYFPKKFVWVKRCQCQINLRCTLLSVSCDVNLWSLISYVFARVGYSVEAWLRCCQTSMMQFCENN